MRGLIGRAGAALRGLTAGLALAGAAAALAPQAQAAPISATVSLTGLTFTDGTPVTGGFMVNAYGYIIGSSVDIVTLNGAIPGDTYSGGGSANGPGGIWLGATEIDFYRLLGGVTDYSTDLYLAFATPVHYGPNVVDTAASYECIASFTCYLPSGTGDRRYLQATASPVLGVPEPTGLALLGGGMLALGLKRRLRVQ
jgi:hypothetical protein